MSVPAFRNSKSKVRRRRSHHALKPMRVQVNKDTGEAVLPHHKVVAAKTAPDPKNAEASAKATEDKGAKKPAAKKPAAKKSAPKKTAPKPKAKKAAPKAK